MYPNSTVAAHSDHDPKIKGPNAATLTGREKMVKGENYLGTPPPPFISEEELILLRSRAGI